MPNDTDDLRIREIRELSAPADVMREFPRVEPASRTVTRARRAVHDILAGDDDRLVVIVGPCSVHDPAAALDYAARLAKLRNRLRDTLEIVMRVYFEKPRTTVGWKGLINDPDLDGSFQIDKGLRIARRPAARDQQARPAGRLRVPRHDHAAISRRPRRLGRHRRAHHREPGAPRTGLRPLLPGRLQERHRRQRQDRRRRGEGGLRAAPFPRRHQERPRGNRRHRRQRRLPHHPAWRQGAELRRGQRRCRLHRAPRGRPGAGGDDRRQPRQQRQEAGEPAQGRRRHRPPGRPTATAASSA